MGHLPLVESAGLWAAGLAAIARGCAREFVAAARLAGANTSWQAEWTQPVFPVEVVATGEAIADPLEQDRWDLWPKAGVRVCPLRRVMVRRLAEYREFGSTSQIPAVTRGELIGGQCGSTRQLAEGRGIPRREQKPTAATSQRHLRVYQRLFAAPSKNFMPHRHLRRTKQDEKVSRDGPKRTIL